MDILLKIKPPEPQLQRFVDSFWCLHNPTDVAKEVVIVPDGNIDLSISRSAEQPFHTLLMGLATIPGETTIAPQTRIMAISFRPLAAEYVFDRPFGTLLDGIEQLPADFWDLREQDLQDFDAFCQKASRKIEALFAGKDMDSRKEKLFEKILASHGAATVKELSEQVHWSSRQINRYFNEQYGLSLKAYSNIVRFRASLQHLKQGKLFPEENFADQSHFIKEIKKLAGVSPKKIARDQNDRFIQFSGLPPS